MISRRTLLRAAGATAAIIALPAHAALPTLDERIDAILAKHVHNGDLEISGKAIDGEVIAAMVEDWLIDRTILFHRVWVTSEGKTIADQVYKINRRGIERGQIALAHRLSPHAGMLMRTAFELNQSPLRRQNYPEVAQRARKRVFTDPPIGGALPVVVLTPEQAEAGDWRMHALRNAYLRPVRYGKTLLALERTPLGVEWFESHEAFLNQLHSVTARVSHQHPNLSYGIGKA
ncbi:hypothetical protein CcrC1_gp451 [Caulobacter phage C1]|nr:hypothetical protein CcrC1_gp451 [Caulobacter phage C1]WGN97865.1 hypothetical protein [Bertelyvirus sp.]